MTEDFIDALGEVDFASLTAAAKVAPRRRSHRNLHDDFSDPVQRLLIAAEPDTYVQPHRHPGKPWEMLVLIQGAMDVLMFSEDGSLEQRIPLRMGDRQLIQYPATQFHGSVVLESGTVILEVKEGPYIQATAKETPPWAPDEQSPDGHEYRDRLRSLGIGQSAR